MQNCMNGLCFLATMHGPGDMAVDIAPGLDFDRGAIHQAET